MLKTKEVEVVLNPNNIKYYEELGYEIPRRRRSNRVSKNKLTVPHGTKIQVKIEHLPLNSNVQIEYYCDFCGAIKSTSYADYNKRKNNNFNKKDACIDCTSKKVKETFKEKYNVEWNTQLDNVKESVKNKLKIDDDIVSRDFESKGYIKLNEYVNIFTEIHYICKKHRDKGVQTTIYNNLKNAEHVCKYCISESLSGENSHLWKGGITNLNNYLRSKIKSWQIDSFNNGNYLCLLTNIKSKNNVVHHVYPFYKIVKETLDILNLDIKEDISLYTEEELIKLTETCLNLHYKYGYGLILVEDIHYLYHSFVKDENINLQTFSDFKQKYYNYEFDDLLEDKYKYVNVLRNQELDSSSFLIDKNSEKEYKVVG